MNFIGKRAIIKLSLVHGESVWHTFTHVQRDVDRSIRDNGANKSSDRYDARYGYYWLRDAATISGLWD